MRAWLLILAACGGGSSSKSTADKPGTSTTSASTNNDGCKAAYADYETKWRAARSEELRDIDFDAASIDEVLAIEVALLPTKADLAKLRGQYTAVAVFLPDSPWPVALDATEVAIAQCGEEHPKPT
jgi:hypothetical protein